MLRKTQGAHDLVQEVMQHHSSPYSEDIIEEVFFGILENPRWLLRYRELEAELGKNVVNSWIAIYVKEYTGMATVREVPAKPGNLIKDYSKLTY